MADSSFVVRSGLTYDRRTGLLMKLNSFHAISLKSVHRGKTRLSSREVFEIYGRARYALYRLPNTKRQMPSQRVGACCVRGCRVQACVNGVSQHTHEGTG